MTQVYARGTTLVYARGTTLGGFGKYLVDSLVEISLKFVT